eukprot:10654944-Heterocapsa_arctica.AAC.1
MHSRRCHSKWCYAAECPCGRSAAGTSPLRSYGLIALGPGIHPPVSPPRPRPGPSAIPLQQKLVRIRACRAQEMGRSINQ